jgi:hypothetical protein
MPQKKCGRVGLIGLTEVLQAQPKESRTYIHEICGIKRRVLRATKGL